MTDPASTAAPPAPEDWRTHQAHAAAAVILAFARAGIDEEWLVRVGGPMHVHIAPFSALDIYRPDVRPNWITVWERDTSRAFEHSEERAVLIAQRVLSDGSEDRL